MRSVIFGFILTLICNVAFAQLGSNLVDPANATHKAVKNGSWQEATTWNTNTVPGVNAQVYIPEGIHVTNHAVTPNIRWINNDGTLDVCTHCDTEINVHTLYTSMRGHTHLGKLGMPVESSAKLNFIPAWFLTGDWQKVSLGHICHGEFTAVGIEKTTWRHVADSELPKGSTKMTVDVVPVRWKVGDKLAIAGTDSFAPAPVELGWVKYQTEYVTITEIVGKDITFSPPLIYRHYKWKPDLVFQVVNLDACNVVIQTKEQAPDTGLFPSAGLASGGGLSAPGPQPNKLRGHQMFMSPMNHMVNVLAYKLGRTDKSQDLTDPRMDVISLTLVPGSDFNPRGRYSDHNHKVGPLNAPSTRKRVIVRDSPGWGMVNHDSNCEWDECVCTECFGAGFCTEEGQERGYMRNCVSFKNRGQGDYITSTDEDHGNATIGDWGRDGSGFWLQGGLVEVSNCYSFDNSGRGFALFQRTLNGYPAIHASVPSYLHFKIIHDKSLLEKEYFSLTHGDSPHAPASSVPIRVFKNNTAYENKVGFQGWGTNGYNGSSSNTWPYQIRGNITNLTIWGRGNQMHLEYLGRLNVDGLRIEGDSIHRGPDVARWSSTNAETPLNMRSKDVTVTNLKVDGMLDRNNWPNRKRVYSDWNNGEWADPNHKISPAYPMFIWKGPHGYELID